VKLYGATVSPRYWRERKPAVTYETTSMAKAREYFEALYAESREHHGVSGCPRVRVWEIK